MELKNLIEQLETAKNNVIRLLEHSNGLIDMHGLSYRAGRVEKIREQINQTL